MGRADAPIPGSARPGSPAAGSSRTAPRRVRSALAARDHCARLRSRAVRDAEPRDNGNRAAPGTRSAFLGVGSGSPRLLPSERMDVADKRPAIVLGEMLPGGHGAAPVTDFPEELAVRLRLDLLRRPVRRLWAESGRSHAIALALGAVTGSAVDLGDLLPLIHDLRVVGQGILLRLFPRGSL